MKCKFCGREGELRFSCCFDCASRGEERLAKRTVIQHVVVGFRQIFRGRRDYARIEFSLAFQRMFRIGDYAEAGYFDWEGINWREP